MKHNQQPQIQEVEIPLNKRPGIIGPVVMDTPLPDVGSDQPTDSVDPNPPGKGGYDPRYDRRWYH